jgi:hypothetical protein
MFNSNTCQIIRNIDQKLANNPISIYDKGMIKPRNSITLDLTQNQTKQKNQKNTFNCVEITL